jgi:phosphotransferase system  glucose/maltose/N-acetylglucosamine-specific IIC component
MRRWHSLLEIVQFPLKTLFVSTIFMGLGGLLLNPNLVTIVSVENRWILTFAELLRYFGGMMIMLFPLLLLIKALSKRYEDSVPVYIGIVGYVALHITTMFFSLGKLLPSAYYPVLGISVNLTDIFLPGSGVIYPIQTGILSAIYLINITRFCYHRSRGASDHGLLPFVDKDTWAAIEVIFLSILGGIGISYLWPFIMQIIDFIFKFIASDITNPVNLFFYGITERILSALSLSRLIREPFWFGILGGSWIDGLGNNFVGDVAIWTAQRANGVYSLGFGRLITPYYVLNIFAVPAFLIAAYQTYTDKINKRRYFSFLIFAIFLSILFGTLLPVEIYMLVATPLLYVIHLFTTGLLFATFEAFSVSVGYTYSGLELVATPASLIDLGIFWRNPGMQRSLTVILVVGILMFVFYYLITRTYYRRIAVDAMNIGVKAEKVQAIIQAFGGLDNIRMAHSTPNRLTILPYDKTLVDFKRVHLVGLHKIVETRAGYSMAFGACSFMLRSDLVKMMREQQRQLLDNTQAFETITDEMLAKADQKPI